jgi:non-specific serine/threonine protein kinase
MDAPSGPDRHLPLQTTSFVGRRHDIDAITQLIEGHRLVTITGSGGVGKTRTVIEVAAQLPASRWDRIEFVDLSPLTDGTSIVSAFAPHLESPNSEDNGAIEALVSFLGASRTLLILDTCEHLLADVSTVVTTLLASCERVCFLMTSRERLALYGEVIYRLPSLDVPSQRVTGIDQARQWAAVDLFIQRATMFDHGLALTDADCDDVIAICNQLEGIPLAIELASARVSALGVRGLRNRLEKGLLATGARNLPLRQQTMHATILWSYGLLNDLERRMLQRLSIFVNGFTLAAAETVCSADGIETDAVAELLASLFDKSLVNKSPEAGSRYRLLDSVRSFAGARLAEANQSEMLARRHAEWLAFLGDRIDARRLIASPWKLRSETVPELANARVALEWALGSGSNEEALLAGRIVGGLRTAWLTTGRRTECRGWAGRTFERLDERQHPQIAAKVLSALIESTSGAEMRAFVDRAIPVFERIGDRSGLAFLHCHLAYTHRRNNRLDDAEAATKRAGDLFSGFESTWIAPYATFLFDRSQLHMSQGRFELARDDIAKGLEIESSIGDDYTLRWQLLRAELDFVTGNREGAVAAAESAIAPAPPRAGEFHSELPQAYCALALLRVACGDLEGGYGAAREVVRLATSSDRLATTDSLDDNLSDVGLVFALVAASRAKWHLAANMLGAVDSARGLEGQLHDAAHGPRAENVVRGLLLNSLQDRLGRDELEAGWLEGHKRSLESLIAQASETT